MALPNLVISMGASGIQNLGTTLIDSGRTLSNRAMGIGASIIRVRNTIYMLTKEIVSQGSTSGTWRPRLYLSTDLGTTWQFVGLPHGNGGGDLLQLSGTNSSDNDANSCAMAYDKRNRLLLMVYSNYPVNHISYYTYYSIPLNAFAPPTAVTMVEFSPSYFSIAADEDGHAVIVADANVTGGGAMPHGFYSRVTNGNLQSSVFAIIGDELDTATEPTNISVAYCKNSDQFYVFHVMRSGGTAHRVLSYDFGTDVWTEDATCPLLALTSVGSGSNDLLINWIALRGRSDGDMDAFLMARASGSSHIWYYSKFNGSTWLAAEIVFDNGATAPNGNGVAVEGLDGATYACQVVGSTLYVKRRTGLNTWVTETSGWTAISKSYAEFGYYAEVPYTIPAEATEDLTEDDFAWKLTQLEPIMTAAKHNIVIEQGQLSSERFIWLDEAGEIVSILSYAGLLLGKTVAGDSATVVKLSSPHHLQIVGAEGEITMKVPGDVSDGYDFDLLQYTLSLFPPSGSALTSANYTSIAVNDNAGSSRGTLTASAGTPFSGISAGDWIHIYSAENAENDGVFQVYSATSTVLTLTEVLGIDNAADTAMTIQLLDAANAVRLVEGNMFLHRN